MNQNQVKLSRRQFLQYTGLAASAAALAACAVPAAPSAAPAAGGEAAAPAGEGIQLQAWSRETGLGQETTTANLQRYSEENDKGVTVEFVYIAQTQGSQADEKLLTAVAGGTPPALYYADRFTVPQFAHEGFFQPITEFAEAAGVTADQYYDFAWAEATYKGDIYCLPLQTDTRALWYNKDILAEAGLDPESPPTNLEELQAATEALTVRDSNGRITRYGLNPIYDQAWLYTWGFIFQGEFQDENGRITFAHPKNIEAMEFVKAFIDQIGIEDIDAMLAACQGTACNDANDYFWTGQTAMTISGNWKVGQQRRFKPDGNYGVVPLPGPEGPAPYGSWAGGWSWAVPVGIEDVATSFDVVNFLCNTEGQLAYCKPVFTIPTNIAASEDPFFREDPNHAVFMDLLPVSHARPPIPLGSKLWDLQFKAIRDEIPHGLKTPEQALTDIDTEINAGLEEIGFFS
jgi:multiple sugar transport system substrate-binding protein